MREAAGLTLDQTSHRLGFSVAHLSNVERGVRNGSRRLVAGYRNLSAATPHPVVQTLRLPPSDTDEPANASVDDFGTRMMRLRLSRGWSLAQLARVTSISRTHLGNLETGRKNPSPTTAAVCDSALNAGGALVALSDAAGTAATAPADPPSIDSLWHPETNPADPQQLWQICAQRLRELRSMAQKDRPTAVLAELELGGRSLADAAKLVAGVDGAALWLLAARYAEFTGWMAQEAGLDADAVRWTQAAARWAAHGGDADMLSYRWERRALITLYQGDAQATIELARQASGERGRSARAAGLAHRREAQGHALAGDRAACERALDDAVALLACSPLPYPQGASWGPNSIADHGDLIRAACLVDLGACHEAAALFGPDPEAGVPRGALRTRTRFMIRGAMAFAEAGDIEYACALASRFLPAAGRLDSATFRADLRRLIATLRRHPRDARARRILPDLHNMVRVH